MEKSFIVERLNHLIGSYTDINKIEPGRDLMGEPASLPTYDMAALFLDVEREFDVNLNELIPGLGIFSPNEIADRILSLQTEYAPN